MVSVISYYEMYQINPVKAREKLLKVYRMTGNKVRETARILNCSCSTVSKWVRRENLSSLSRRPRNVRRKLSHKDLIRIAIERKKTNFGRRRLKRHLESKYGLNIKETTIAYWLRKMKLSRPCKQRKRFKGIRYYNWEELKPFEFIQIDTKDIKDAKTLPKEVYWHLRERGLPRYQFTAIDVKTRIKFISYGYERSRNNGIGFMKMIVDWIRSFGIRYQIKLQTDWGGEFGGMSERVWRRIQKNEFDKRGTLILKIRKRRWGNNAIVERTHRTDDEEFYIPKLLEIQNNQMLLEASFGYIYYFNIKRPHFSSHLKGLSPVEILKKLSPSIDPSIALFPPLLLDYLTTSKPYLSNPVDKFYILNTVRDVIDTY